MSKCRELQLEISEEIIQTTLGIIKDGILRKLSVAKKILEFNKEVSSGIYVYAMEELGKLQLLKNVRNGKLDYLAEFRNHNFKFNKAEEYLKSLGYSECFALHEGAFEEDAFDEDSFDVDTHANTRSRLGIFYVDFIYDKTNRIVTGIRDIPPVDKKELGACISELENLVRGL